MPCSVLDCSNKDENKMKNQMKLQVIVTLFCMILTITSVLPAAPKQNTPNSKEGLSLFIGGGYKDFMLASDTFDTLYDSSGKPVFAAGLKYDIEGGFFFGVEAGYISASGERVWVSTDGTTIKTGITEDLTIIPLTAILGFNFIQTDDLSVYIGAGGGLYLVNTDCEVDTYDRNESGFGFFGAVGADFNLSESIYLNIEGRYDSLTGIIGDSGVPALFEEDNLGGITGLLRIGFRL